MTDESFTKLCEQPHRWLIRRIARKVGYRPEPLRDAQDIVQEALREVVEKPDAFKHCEGRQFQYKLKDAALRKAKNFRRLHWVKYTERLPESKEGYERSQEGYDAPVFWPSSRCQRIIEYQELIADVRISLGRLSPQQRSIAELIGEGYTIREIGGIINVSKSEVNRRWHRDIKPALERMLADYRIPIRQLLGRERGAA